MAPRFAFYGVCATMLMAASLSWWVGWQWQGPVPLDGDHDIASLGLAAVLFVGSIMVVLRVLATPEQRWTASGMSLMLCAILSGTSLPAHLYEANAGDDDPPALTLTAQECFLSLATHQPARRRTYHLLQTLPPSAELKASAIERRISRKQHEALVQSSMQPGQLVRLKVTEGRLGWPYVEAIDPVDGQGLQPACQ